LSPGTESAVPLGENCDVREILAAATAAQDEEFDSMMKVLHAESGPKLRAAADALRTRNQSLGDDGPRSE
jgi:type IV secretion system protein VirD4